AGHGSVVQQLVGRSGVGGVAARQHTAGPQDLREVQGHPASVRQLHHGGGSVMTAPADLSRLTLGTAPDSWGVWFDKDPHQVTWQQYLDELPKAGYRWTELGPPGFLPTDTVALNEELAKRDLKVAAGTCFAALHQGKRGLERAIR